MEKHISAVPALLSCWHVGHKGNQRSWPFISVTARRNLSCPNHTFHRGPRGRLARHGCPKHPTQGGNGLIFFFKPGLAYHLAAEKKTKNRKPETRECLPIKCCCHKCHRFTMTDANRFYIFATWGYFENGSSSVNKHTESCLGYPKANELKILLQHHCSVQESYVLLVIILLASVFLWFTSCCPELRLNAFLTVNNFLNNIIIFRFDNARLKTRLIFLCKATKKT